MNPNSGFRDCRMTFRLFYNYQQKRALLTRMCHAELLSTVLKNYPGVTVGLNRLEFSGKFEPLIHRWAEFEAAIDKLGDETEDDRTTKE